MCIRDSRYTDNLVGLALRKRTIFLSRPVYVGFTVLDVSKLIMYDFHYRYAVAKYGNKKMVTASIVQRVSF